MTSTVFCGCSYVQGSGLVKESADPDLWVNIVHRNSPHLVNTSLINLGEGGSNNHAIMLTAMSALLAYPDCKFMFVCWTNPKRMWVNPGFELYDTSVYFENARIKDINLNPKIRMSGKYMEDIRNRFFLLTHPHYDLIETLTYTALINTMAQHHQVKVFFVNSLLNIDSDFFVHITDYNRMPSQTTPLTQNFLQLDTRSDEEYFKLYDLMHQQYRDSLGLSAIWLNIDKGYRQFFYIDRATDDLHPGPASNKKFADFVVQKINDILTQT